MLQAAAQRGVKVNVIVYKEVTQALTCKFSPVVQATAILLILDSVVVAYQASSRGSPSEYCGIPPSRPFA